MDGNEFQVGITIMTLWVLPELQFLPIFAKSGSIRKGPKEINSNLSVYLQLRSILPKTFLAENAFLRRLIVCLVGRHSAPLRYQHCQAGAHVQQTPQHRLTTWHRSNHLDYHQEKLQTARQEMRHQKICVWLCVYIYIYMNLHWIFVGVSTWG